MEETKEQQAPSMAPVEPGEIEMGHADKLVGVFTEPGNTFSKMVKAGAKTTDWIIPILIVILVAILSNIVMMSNPIIKHSIVEKQMQQMEKTFDDMIAKGQLTEAQKEEQMNNVRDRMEQGGMAMNTIFTSIGITIFTFLTFFVVSGVFMLFSKFALKGEGTYKDAMSAYGLPYYIVIIQVIIMMILALVMNKFFTGTSVAEFAGMEKSDLAGFLLSKLDPFSIWFYSVISIGFAKMFKSENTVKYFIMIFGLWIGFGLILFFIAKAVPFLSFLAQ